MEKELERERERERLKQRIRRERGAGALSWRQRVAVKTPYRAVEGVGLLSKACILIMLLLRSLYCNMIGILVE